MTLLHDINYNEIMNLEDADSELREAHDKLWRLIQERQMLQEWFDRGEMECPSCGFTPEIPSELSEAIVSARKEIRRCVENINRMEIEYGI